LNLDRAAYGYAGCLNNSGDFMARRPQAAAAKPVYHLLNMGKTKFGDCILVQIAGKTILIDGGHPGDFKDNADRPSIPRQLGAILGSAAPFHFDLLVVTHCHQDHIGCLPRLVADKTITCDRALVADEKLGFGLDINGGTDARVANASPQAQALVAALTEEDHSSLRGDALDAFLADAASLQGNYNVMLKTLEDAGTRVVRYRQGTAAEKSQVAQIVSDMSGTGLVIFGPTSQQLAKCAEVLQHAGGTATDMLANVADATASVADLYLQLMANRGALDAVQGEPGAAKNCQSIVLAFGPAGQRVLLPGDMQFAKPQITAIAGDVTNLVQDVTAHAPYAFVKMPHHSSDNGTNEALLKAYGWPQLLGHSGGINDATHPDPDTLTLLKSLASSHSFVYARTDRNGMLTVDPSGGTASGFKVEHGQLNDFTPNKAADEVAVGPVIAQVAAGAGGPLIQVATASAAPFVEITFVRIPYEDGRVSIDGRVVEISRGAATNTGGSPANDTSGRAAAAYPASGTSLPQLTVQPGSLAGGRSLPKLLFVTDPDRLAENIGPEVAKQALSLVEAAGHKLVRGSGTDLIAATRQAIDSDHKGVVILGGYDVVPSQRVDVLDAELRGKLSSELIASDPDAFVVWSDDAYGDKEPDGIPELPVSRLPDARFAPLFLSMLTNPGGAGTGRFGLRNSARPFAIDVFNVVPGQEQLLASEPTNPAQLSASAIAKPNVYFMLHGDYHNTAAFWGENADGAVVAIDVNALPSSGIGLAFAGCCWGALTVSEPAFLGETGPTPRMVERSMALLVLKAGARAFVGSTGVHYSPGATGDFFGGPMHTAFWKEIGAGRAPAEALFNARSTYLMALPHGRTTLFDLAVERKIYKEFTCLGLGW
jgi:beta-lactamase superfamily II metal-dependent hydrolase